MVQLFTFIGHVSMLPGGRQALPILCSASRYAPQAWHNSVPACMLADPILVAHGAAARLVFLRHTRSRQLRRCRLETARRTAGFIAADPGSRARAWCEAVRP